MRFEMGHTVLYAKKALRLSQRPFRNRLSVVLVILAVLTVLVLTVLLIVLVLLVLVVLVILIGHNCSS